VAAVFYPGLPCAPRYELVQELFINGGAGGMLAFEPCGGMEAAEMVLKVSFTATCIARGYKFLRSFYVYAIVRDWI
jgi:cystathionine beta-lyase/cystathionine gamma-synthase